MTQQIHPSLRLFMGWVIALLCKLLLQHNPLRQISLPLRWGSAVIYRLSDKQIIQALDMLRGVLRASIQHRATLIRELKHPKTSRVIGVVLACKLIPFAMWNSDSNIMTHRKKPV